VSVTNVAWMDTFNKEKNKEYGSSMTPVLINNEHLHVRTYKVPILSGK